MVVREGAAGGLAGLLPIRVPVVLIVVVRLLCCVVVVVVEAVVVRDGAGTTVSSEMGGAKMRVKRNLACDVPQPVDSLKGERH